MVGSVPRCRVLETLFVFRPHAGNFAALHVLSSESHQPATPGVRFIGGQHGMYGDGGQHGMYGDVWG